MRLNNYDYNNKAPGSGKKGLPISPGYLIFLVVILLVFIFVLILLLGIRKSRINVEESLEGEKTSEVTEKDEDTAVKYEGYAEQIDSAFSDIYGFRYVVSVNPAQNNTYFLDGVMTEIIAGGGYNISGFIAEKGVQGEIQSQTMSDVETFAFTDRGSLLNVDVSNYIGSLPAEDARTELFGFESDIDLGYTVSGKEFLDNLKDTLINSEYKDEKESDDSFTVTYPSGSLKPGTGRKYFDKVFENYPGDLTLTVRVEETDTGKNIFITGVGEVNFEADFYEIDNIGEYDMTALDEAYTIEDKKKEPFYFDMNKGYTLEDYLREYGN